MGPDFHRALSRYPALLGLLTLLLAVLLVAPPGLGETDSAEGEVVAEEFLGAGERTRTSGPARSDRAPSVAACVTGDPLPLRSGTRARPGLAAWGGHLMPLRL